MEKYIISDISIENVKNSIKNMNLKENERYEIKEIKKPINLFFFKLKGKYEVSIFDKNEIKEKTIKKEIKENKNIERKKEKNINKFDKKETKEKVDKLEKIEKLINNHFKLSKLNIKITNKKVKERNIIYTLEGKDLYIFSKNNGLLNLSKMVNNAFPKLKKRVEFVSNEERKKMEAKYRKLARNVGNQVLETKEEKDLYGLDPLKRKIIHEELFKFRNIKTESFGEGKDRYLKVSYVEENKED